MATFVPTELYTKATGSLQKEVEDELNIPDPTPKLAKAVMENDDENINNHNTRRQDSSNK